MLTNNIANQNNPRSIKLILALIMLGVIALMLNNGRANAFTWDVPSTSCPTIQSGIDSAAGKLDTVLVAPGMYDTAFGEQFPLLMKSGVILISSKGADSTIVNADTTARVFKCVKVDSTSAIIGFTITGGKAFGATQEDSCGGGIFADSSSLIITDNIIKYNTALRAGGGIACWWFSDSVFINNNIIKYNYARGGGGIYCYNSSPLIIHNTIDSNDTHIMPSSNGGGILCSGSSPIIQGNRITNNITWNNGGGIACQYTAPHISKNLISNNISYSSFGGGALFCYQSSPLIEGNAIIDNKASNGGTIYVLKASVYPFIMRGNTIMRNISLNGNSNLFFEDNAKVEIESNAIIDNSDEIYVAGTSDTITLSDNNIYYNTYQPADSELVNNSSINMPAINNWWGTADPSQIALLIGGLVTYIPYRTSPNSNAPGEPSAVYSVSAKEDSAFAGDLVYANIGDTIYLEIQGADWRAASTDPAVVILRSSMDTSGIAVALLETDTSTGIYRGKAVIDSISLDIEDRIGVNSKDTIYIISNVDPMKCDTVFVGVTGVEGSAGCRMPKAEFSMEQNYPNPFRQFTTINYQLPKAGKVSINIYNITGQLVKTLVDKHVEAGSYACRWNGRDDRNRMVSNGVYFSRLVAGQTRITNKLIILR